MILGMPDSTFTLVHVVLSLIGIVCGIVVVVGMLSAKRLAGLTAVFLATTVLTSATGFLFPSQALGRRRLLAHCRSRCSPSRFSRSMSGDSPVSGDGFT